MKPGPIALARTPSAAWSRAAEATVEGHGDDLAHSSSASSPTGPGGPPITGLSTRRSRFAVRSVAKPTSASVAAPSATSAPHASGLRVFRVEVRDHDRGAALRKIPRDARCAMACPIPDAAPVTIAVLPSNRSCTGRFSSVAVRRGAVWTGPRRRGVFGIKPLSCRRISAAGERCGRRGRMCAESRRRACGCRRLAAAASGSARRGAAPHAPRR